MNIQIQYILLAATLLSGCTPAKLVMNIDSALEENATVYTLSYPNSLTDKISGKRLNITFGPYKVTNADASGAKTSWEAEDPDPIFRYKNVEKSGNRTTTTKIGAGPTEILGFRRTPEEGEPTINKVAQSITYKFKIGKNKTWNAACDYKAKKRVQHQGSRTIIGILSSNYTCQYTAENKNNETWTLYMDENGKVTMTQKGKPNTLIAYSTGGMYIMPNKKPGKTTTRTTGYTWQQSKNGHNKKIAAISVAEETSRLLLHKENSKNINNILSMASTGLLIYNWEVQHN